MTETKPPSLFLRAWESISLRSKLTALSVGLIGLLLVVSSFGTIALLRTYLQQNIDTMLTATAQALRDEDPVMLEDRLATRQLQLPSLPSDYYIAYLGVDGSLLIGLVSSAQRTNTVPNLDGFDISFVLSTNGKPFEVDAGGTITDEGRGDGWRIITVPLTSMPGSIVVALPTGGNSAIIGQYAVIGAGFGILLLVVSGLSIWLTITSAIRPLREVERTAALVAKGDIGQRLIIRDGKTEIARLNRSLNSMLDGIETAMKSRNQTLDQMRRFVADASHELRTPLVSLRGYAELYRMGALTQPEQVAEAMARIESEAVRMSGLVENLLTLARQDESTAIEKSQIDILAIARNVAKDISVANSHKNPITICDLNGIEYSDQQQLDIPANANGMQQVLTNLISNAARFSDAGQPIEIAVGFESHSKNSKCIIEVRDHGEGIPEALRQKVFERFYRVDNSRNSETGGSGLGLAIASSIVHRHGGDIKAVETEGGGATFKIYLPGH